MSGKALRRKIRKRKDLTKRRERGILSLKYLMKQLAQEDRLTDKMLRLGETRSVPMIGALPQDRRG